jgi:hypothetical protein
MKANDFNRFSKDIVKWAGNVASMDELNSWLALSTNIWNNVTQPDKGNRSANEIIAEYDLAIKTLNRLIKLTFIIKRSL